MFSDYPGQDVYGSVCRGWTEALPKEGKCFEISHCGRAQGRSAGLARVTEGRLPRSLGGGYTSVSSYKFFITYFPFSFSIQKSLGPVGCD